MSFRINYYQASPEAMQAMMGLEKVIKKQYPEIDGIPKTLLELVKIRVSQLNQCAFCLDMHSKDALAEGDNTQRLLLLSAWREAPCYSAQERAALAWAEALTLVATSNISEELFAQVNQAFTEKQLTNLTLAICSINGWNRFAVGLGANVGSYQPGQFD